MARQCAWRNSEPWANQRSGRSVPRGREPVDGHWRVARFGCYGPDTHEVEAVLLQHSARRQVGRVRSDQHSREGMVTAHLGHEGGDKLSFGSSADERRVANRVIDPDVVLAGLHGRGLSGIVGPAVPLSPADGSAVFGDHHQHDCRRPFLVDPVPVIDDLRLGGGIRKPPASDMSSPEPHVDRREVFLSHRPHDHARQPTGPAQSSCR